MSLPLRSQRRKKLIDAPLPGVARREPIVPAAPKKTASPVDAWANDRGPKLWAKFHRRPFEVVNLAVEKNWIEGFSLLIPCGECKAHWIALMKSRPPEMENAESYFAWGVAMHNAVNERLGKPVMKLDEARAIWQQGIAT